MIAALFQLWLGKRHQKDKRYGPSPANNYTSGSARGGFFARRRAKKAARRDVEAGTIGTNGIGGHHHETGRLSHDNRLSHNTATTDSYVGNKYEANPLNDGVLHNGGTGGLHNGGAGGYHTGPVGTGVNPYGYENERSHAV